MPLFLLARGRASEALPHFERGSRITTKPMVRKIPERSPSSTTTPWPCVILAVTPMQLPTWSTRSSCSAEIHGEKHSMTLIALHNYALIVDAMGRSREALPLFEQSLRLRTEVLGEKHPNTFRAMTAYATALKKVGRPIEALSLHERSYNLQLAMFGEKHPRCPFRVEQLCQHSLFARALGRCPFPLRKSLAAADRGVGGRAQGNAGDDPGLGGCFVGIGSKAGGLARIIGAPWRCPSKRWVRSIPIR